MAATLTFTERVATGSREISAEQSIVNTGRLSIVGETIPAGATDKPIAFAVKIAQLVGIYIKATQALLLETNDGTTPDDTLSLVANVPYVWYSTKYDALKFGDDITILYFTNAGGADATLDIEAIYDATP